MIDTIYFWILFVLVCMLANKMDELPKLMQQALNYLHKFWKQVFAYRNDGEYSIDNLAAERYVPKTYSARARCSLVVFWAH